MKKTMIREIQINLHYSKAGSATLLLRLAHRGEDLALIQEPWSIANKVCGLGHKNIGLVYAKCVGRPRSCILIKYNLMAYLLPNFNEDLTTVTAEISGHKYRISSSYMPHDLSSPPPPDPLKRLVIGAKYANVGLLIDGDANSHHTIWGSTNVNERGESFFNFIISNNLMVCNTGMGS